MQHFTKCIVLLYEEHRKQRMQNAERKMPPAGIINF